MRRYISQTVQMSSLSLNQILTRPLENLRSLLQLHLRSRPVAHVQRIAHGREVCFVVPAPGLRAEDNVLELLAAGNLWMSAYRRLDRDIIKTYTMLFLVLQTSWNIQQVRLKARDAVIVLDPLKRKRGALEPSTPKHIRRPHVLKQVESLRVLRKQVGSLVQ